MWLPVFAYFLPMRTEKRPKRAYAVVKNVEKLIFILETLVFCFNITENKGQENGNEMAAAGRRSVRLYQHMQER